MRLLDIVPLGLFGLFILLACLPAFRGRVALLWAAAAGAGLIAFWQAMMGRWQAWPLAGGALLAVLALGWALRRGQPVFARPLSIAGAAGRLALLAFGLIGAFLVWSFPATRLPSSLGPDRVGTVTFDVVDQARTDSFAPRPGPRRLQVQLWYPADDATDTPLRPYMTQQEAAAVAAPFAIQFSQPTITWRHLPLLVTNSHAGASPKASARPRPLIIFNHGYWSIPMQNSALMEALASRGYIVMSISHPYDTAAVRFEDGSVAAVDSSQTMKIIMETEGLPDLETYLSSPDPGLRYAALMRLKAMNLSKARMLESSVVWREDIAFLLDGIAGRTLPENARAILAGADMDRIGLVGMSFGGSTTAGFCLRDRRCKAGVNLDAMAWDQDQYAAAVPVPFMVLMSDPRANRPEADILRGRTDFMYERPEDAGTTPFIHRFLITGATHPDFTDFTILLRGPARKKVMRLGTIDGPTMLSTTNEFVLAFFDAYLRDVGRDRFPAAMLAAHPQARVHDVGYVRNWARSPAGQAMLRQPPLSEGN